MRPALAEGQTDGACARENAPATSSAVLQAFCLLLAAAGGLLLIYLLFLPRDLIADETEYLTEAISIARGAPQGWELRAVVYPALAVPFVWIAEALSGADPLAAIFAARSFNTAIAFLSAAAAYALGRQLGGRLCGLAAVVFTVFPWAWAWSATRFMMDVPGGTWLMLAVLILLRRDWRPLHSALIVLLGGLAVFTKFQLAPPVLAVGLWHLGQQPDWHARMRTALVMAGAAAMVMAIYCASEYLVHGHPFGSLVAFYNYNIEGLDTFVETYGACEPAIAYLEAMPHVFSYLLPILAVIGAGLGLARRAGVAPILCVTAAYVIPLLYVCHKQPRYLISIAPFVAVIAAYGAVELYRGLQGVSWLRRKLGMRLDRLVAAGFGLGMLAVVASLLPRGELPALVARQEACPAFVFGSLGELADLSGERRFALVHPCYVPEVFLEGHDVGYEDLGFTPYTQQRALRLLRANIPAYGAIVVATGSEAEQLLIEEYGSLFSLYRRSPAGHYVIYAARPQSAQQLLPDG